MKQAIYLAIAAGLVWGCAHKEPKVAKTESPAEIRAERRPEPEIRNAVDKILALAGLGSVSAIVNENTGYVRLFGRVPSPAVRDGLIQAVGALRGVRVFEHDLEIVAPHESVARLTPPDVWDRLSESRFHLIAAFVVGLLIWAVWKSKRPRFPLGRAAHTAS
jgi:hypothetical protein